MAKHFGFAFLKVYLEHYIQSFSKKEQLDVFTKIDELLSKKEHPISANLRFYCLKLLRSKLPIKEIQKEFVHTKRSNWIGEIKEIDFFFENESRSLIVPKPSEKVTAKMTAIVQGIIDSRGKPDTFDQLFEEGCISVANRYHILTFFFRFYYSMVYDFKAYKQAVV